MECLYLHTTPNHKIYLTIIRQNESLRKYHETGFVYHKEVFLEMKFLETKLIMFFVILTERISYFLAFP